MTTNNTFTDQFISAAFTPENETPEKVLVKFKDRSDLIEYTVNILHLLKTDPDTEYILDADTGVIIYEL